MCRGLREAAKSLPLVSKVLHVAHRRSLSCRQGRMGSRLLGRALGGGTPGLGGSQGASNRPPRAGTRTPYSCVSISGREHKSDRQLPDEEGRWVQLGTLGSIQGQLL